MAAASSTSNGWQRKTRGGHGSGYFSATSSESCTTAAGTFRSIPKVSDIVIAEDLAIEASLPVDKPVRQELSVVDWISDTEEQIQQGATRCLDQPSLGDDVTTLSSSQRSDNKDLLQVNHDEKVSEGTLPDVLMPQATIGPADLRHSHMQARKDSSPQDTRRMRLDDRVRKGNATIDDRSNQPMALANPIPWDVDEENHPLVSELFVANEADTKIPQPSLHDVVHHETLGKGGCPKEVSLRRCESNEEKKTDDWSCGILPSFSDLTGSSSQKIIAPVLSLPEALPSITIAGAFGMPFGQAKAPLHPFAPCDLNGPDEGYRDYSSEIVYPAENQKGGSDCIVVSISEWKRKKHEAEIKRHQLALLADTVSMLESKLNVFRHELRNRKALTEKTTKDHLREITKVHSHYRRLIQEKDESIEILNKALEKERLESKAQLEQARARKEPTVANEDSLGQEMDTLQCEIKRIADAYAKVLAQDKELQRHVQPQPRSGGPRSRFILLCLAVLFGTLAGIYLLVVFHEHSEIGFDFLCSPALPSTQLDAINGKSATFEAPWWVPSYSSAKADVFALVCGPRDRLNLSWEPYPNKGRGSLKLNKLKHGEEVSLWTRHIATSVEINTDHVKILHQTGNVERLPLYCFKQQD